MEYEFKEDRLSFDKVITELDKLVFDFVSVLEKQSIKYVIVSGYVAILLGRSRATDDVDIFIENIDKDRFSRLYSELDNSGFEPFNSQGEDDTLDMLNKNEGPRFAKKGQAQPNFELKFPRNKLNMYSLDNPVSVTLNKRHTIKIAPIELQVAYKLYLGSEKDYMDAAHLYAVFKETLDKKRLDTFIKQLGIKDSVVKEILGEIP